MTNMRNVLFHLVQSNPQVAQNPLAKQAVNVIQNGSEEQKRQMIENMCQTFGMDQSALAQSAGSFLRGNMGFHQ